MIVALLSSPAAEPTVREYAELFTGSRHGRLCTIHVPDHVAGDSAAASFDPEIERVFTALRQFSQSHRIGLIVCEWFENPHALQQLLHLANDLNTPAIFIRQGNTEPPQRVVVATAGGPNVLEQMWIADKVASVQNLPVRLIHWRAEDEDPLPIDAETDETVPSLERLSMSLLGMHAAFETCQGEHFTECALAHLQKGDILVIGAPHAPHESADFFASIPHGLARQETGPVILLSSPITNRISLNRLLWGELLLTNQQPQNKMEALDLLVENLIRHNQLPRSRKNDILDLALRREDLMTTAVDCDTAFPHVTLPGFFGMAASMIICPDGVDFGSDSGRLTHFIALFITSDGLYDEYLAALAKLAKRMINAEVRKALLACDTSAQALNVLEPPEIFIQAQDPRFALGVPT